MSNQNMKIVSFILAVLTLSAFTFTACNNESAGAVAVENAKTETFNVNGECGMCKKRIESAARAVNGVGDAKWDVDSHAFTTTFDEKKTSVDAIAKAIAAVGHDAGKFRADDGVYNNLEECCHYERTAD